MKNLLIFLSFVCASGSLLSQDSIISNSNRHEVGIDASPLLERFLFSSGSYRYSYSPYYLSYRYHFTNWDLRTHIGGSYDKNENVVDDTIFGNSERSYFQFRVGVEGKMDFARRWQFFYGLDLYTASSRVWDELVKSAAETDTYETIQRSYGAAPLLGFRFKINDRLSLLTESSFLVYYIKGEDKRTYSDSPEYSRLTKSEGVRTQFNPPFSLFLNYNF